MPLYTVPPRSTLRAGFAQMRDKVGFSSKDRPQQQQSPQQRAAQRRPLAPSQDAFGTVQRSNEQRTSATQLTEPLSQPVVDASTLGTVAAAMTPAGAGSPQAMAQEMLQQFGWGPEHWDALNQLVSHESSWNPTAQNPTSTAYGLFQFLNGTWSGTGIAKTSDPRQQILAGLRYIQARYGSPQAAWQFWQQNHWY